MINIYEKQRRESKQKEFEDQFYRTSRQIRIMQICIICLLFWRVVLWIFEADYPNQITKEKTTIEQLLVPGVVQSISESQTSSTIDHSEQ
jgi:hypothetical protein